MKWTLDKDCVIWNQRALERARVEPDDDADLQGEDDEEEEDDISDLQGEDDDDEEERTMQITSWRPKRTKKTKKKKNPLGVSRVKRQFQRVLEQARRLQLS
jgi:hypothetical protein